MAIRAVAVATIILLIFALIGEDLLRTLGISLASFRIAGGLMLFLIALDMVFEKRTERRESRAQKIIDTPEVEDVSIFPMAMPMRSEEHTSELQSLMRISYAVFCLKKKKET